MDLIQSLPVITKDDQARDIYQLITIAQKKGDNGIWYRPPNNIPIDPSVKSLLESKGYAVFDQSKYELKWTRNGPVRGNKHTRYWIRIRS